LARKDHAPGGFVAVAPRVVVEFIIERHWQVVHELKGKDWGEDDCVGGVIEELIDVVGGVCNQIRKSSLDANGSERCIQRGLAIRDAAMNSVPGISEWQLRATAEQKKLRAPVAMAKDIGVDDVSCDRSHGVLRKFGSSAAGTVGFTMKAKERTAEGPLHLLCG
jgi:hypothetical protein